MTLTDALTLKLDVSKEKKQLRPYMAKCLRLNYLTPEVDDIIDI